VEDQLKSLISENDLSSINTNNLPLVTVNILSFNRKDELRNTLTKVYEQDYKNIEVIVVDNASTDGSAEMVQKEFPTVNLIQMQKNIGIAGWNEGFKIAKGEYVLVLDDDSYPEKNAIKFAVKYMIKNLRVAITGYAIHNHHLNRIENDEYKTAVERITQNVNGFIGCGALLRRTIFLKAGGYDPNIFLYFNELDLSIRIAAMNYTIAFLRNNLIFHMYSSIARGKTQLSSNIINERRFTHGFRSYAFYLYKNFSFHVFFFFFTKLLVSNFLIAIRLHYFISYVKSILLIAISLFSGKVNRNPAPYSIQKRYAFGNFKFNNIFLYNE